MATPVPTKYFKTIVNGREEVVSGPWVTAPTGHQEISYDEAVQILNKNGQQNLISTLPPPNADSGYVIGPNGNLMDKNSAANYQPSPQELAQGIKPTGKYATGEFVTLANGAIVPKGGAAETGGNLAKPPVGTLASATVGGITPPTVNLEPGSKDTVNVKKLQDYLVANGYMTQEEVDTGYGTYGPRTTAAVAKLQQSLGVDNKTGVGYFGPRTIAAIGGDSGTGTGGGTGGGTSGGGSGGSGIDPSLLGILDNPNLSGDQKAAIQAIFNAVKSNDTDTAKRVKEAMEAASKFSDPYFKAQVRLATDALSRGLSSKEGDLAFAEKQKMDALKELRDSTVASKDLLSFQQQQELKQLGDKYEADLGNTRDALAASGFTSSSKRARAEQILNENNTGLVESSNKQFGYKTGNLDRTLASAETSTADEIANLRRLTSEGKLDLTRNAEATVGTDNLSSLGYTGLLGGVGGEVPRKQVQDQLAFASNFVF